MAEDRRSAIGGEAVGARLGRLLRRNRTQEEQDILEAYRRQVPVDEIRRRRAAATSPAEAAKPSRAASISLGEDEARAENARRAMLDADAEVAGAGEMRALLNQRRTQRQPRPNNARLSPRAAAATGMSEAEVLNQRELDRIRAENEAESRRASVAESVAQTGGSGDIGAASARARGEQVGPPGEYNMKKGGRVKKMAKGGVVKMAAGGASKRGDGCAMRGKTKGRMV